MNQYSPLIFLSLLALAALACSLGAPVGAGAAHLVTTAEPTIDAGSKVTAVTPELTMPAATPTPPACVVHTGQPGGRLTIRACAGLACPALGYATEGQRLNVLFKPGPWLQVQTDELQGWVNAKLCEVNP